MQSASTGPAAGSRRGHRRLQTPPGIYRPDPEPILAERVPWKCNCKIYELDSICHLVREWKQIKKDYKELMEWVRGQGGPKARPNNLGTDSDSSKPPSRRESNSGSVSPNPDRAMGNPPKTRGRQPRGHHFRNPPLTDDERKRLTDRISELTLEIALLQETLLPLPFDDYWMGKNLGHMFKQFSRFSWAYTESEMPMDEDPYDAATGVGTWLKALAKDNVATRIPELIMQCFPHGAGNAIQAMGMRKFRNRCVDTILLNCVLRTCFTWPPLGIASTAEISNSFQTLMETFTGTDEEKHRWKATTIHLMSKRPWRNHRNTSDLIPNARFEIQMDYQALTLTDTLLSWIQDLGIIDEADESLASKQRLQIAIFDAARMGLLCQRAANWRLIELEDAVKIGDRFNPDIMRPVDSYDSHYILRNNPNARVTLVIHQPWAKLVFGDRVEGGKEEILEENTIIKARVSLVDKARLDGRDI